MNNPLLKTKLTGKEKSKLYDCIDRTENYIFPSAKMMYV